MFDSIEMGRIPVRAMADEGLSDLRETPAAKRVITEGGLPELVGSNVDAAKETRTQILIEADDVLTRLRSDEIITEAQADTDIVSPRQVSTGQVHAAEAALNRLRGNTDADWWLRQAGRGAGEILAAMMQEPAG